MTSAYIWPRSRKIGLSTRNPWKTTSPKTPRATRVRSVTRGLSRSITTKARLAVRRPPASSTSPVPTRFRKPSTSYMTRDTRSPVLFASWNAIGSRPTCSWTLIRMSAMSFCAAFETSWTRANELSPCTTVAPTTAPTSGRRSATLRPPITSSTRYLVEAGSTRPETRLTAMSRKATARSPRRGLTSAQTSGSRAFRRSGFRPRADCFDSRVTTRAAPLMPPSISALRARADMRGTSSPLWIPRDTASRTSLGMTGPGRPALHAGRDSGGASSRATRRLRSPSPFGLAGLAELLDDPPQVVDPAAPQAGDDRAIQPVQELLPAPAADKKGDEVAGRSMVQDLHHARRIRKVHTG